MTSVKKDDRFKKLVGKKVEVEGHGAGILLFYGGVQFGKGKWCGVVLEAAEGKNDGSVDGVRYFECEADHGIFVEPDKVAAFDAAPKKKAAPAPAAKPKKSSDSITPSSSATPVTYSEEPAGTPSNGHQEEEEEEEEEKAEKQAEASAAVLERLKRINAALGVGGGESVTDMTQEEMLANIEARLGIQGNASAPAAAAAAPSNTTQAATSGNNEQSEEKGDKPKKQAPAVAPKRKSADVNATPESGVSTPDTAGGRSGSAMCASCMLAIADGGVRAASNSLPYHEKCAVCSQCQKPVSAESAGAVGSRLYCSVHLFGAQQAAAADAPVAPGEKAVSGGDLKAKLAKFQQGGEETPKKSADNEARGNVSDALSKLEGGSGSGICNNFTAHAFVPDRCANCKQPLSAHSSQPKDDVSSLKRGGSVRGIVTKHEAASRGVTMPEGAPADALPSSSIRDRTSSLLNAAKSGTPSSASSASSTPARRTTVGSGGGGGLGARGGSLNRKQGTQLAAKLQELESASSSSTSSSRPVQVDEGLQRAGSVRASMKAFLKPAGEQAKDKDEKPKAVEPPSMSLRDRMASLSGDRPKPFEEDAAARAASVAQATTAPVAAAPTKSLSQQSSNERLASVPEQQAEPVATSKVEEEEEKKEEEEQAEEAAAPVAEEAKAEEPEPAKQPEPEPEPEVEMDEDEKELAALRKQIEALKAGVPPADSKPAESKPAETAAPAAAAPAAVDPPATAPTSAAAAPAKAPSPDFYGSDDEDDAPPAKPAAAVSSPPAESKPAAPAAAAAANPFNPFASAGTAAPAKAPAKASFNPFG